MRIFVPTSVKDLFILRHNGFTAPVTAYAVTGGLRESYAEGDADELEYAASAQAAHASLRLVEVTDPRRVVVAADVPDSAVRVLPGELGEVEVAVDVRLELVASVHVDDVEAAADVAAAVQALDAASAGDEDAGFVVDGAEGHELLWYDVSELDALLDD
jgi:hypothetical protein